jgi:hypothetical protein
MLVSFFFTPFVRNIFHSDKYFVIFVVTLEMHSGPFVSFCPILIRIEMFRHILVKLHSMTFHENPFAGSSHILKYGQPTCGR